MSLCPPATQPSLSESYAVDRRREQPRKLACAPSARACSILNRCRVSRLLHSRLPTESVTCEASMSKLLITCPGCGFPAFVDSPLELQGWLFTSATNTKALCPG